MPSRIPLPSRLVTFILLSLLWNQIASSVTEDSPIIELLETDRITIFSESAFQRKYAERFSETVYEAAFETTGEPAGKGLVIIGNGKDSHPILVGYRNFLWRYES